MNKEVPVSEIMSTKLVTIHPTQSLYEAKKLFHRYNIRHLPVVEKNKLVGMISYTDILRISFADLDENDESIIPMIYEMYSIPQIMTRVQVFVEATTSIIETAEIWANQSIHSLNVIEVVQLVCFD